MLYRIQKKEIPQAARVLADAFHNDPLWQKILAAENDIEKKYKININKNHLLNNLYLNLYRL